MARKSIPTGSFANQASAKRAVQKFKGSISGSLDPKLGRWTTALSAFQVQLLGCQVKEPEELRKNFSFKTFSY
jgi:hypothetical protein